MTGYLFCYVCNALRSDIIIPGVHICPWCDSEITAVVNDPITVTSNPFLSFDDESQFLLTGASSGGSSGFEHMVDIRELFRAPMARPLRLAPLRPGEFNPIEFAQNYLHVLGVRGGNAEFGQSLDGFNLREFIGDYVYNALMSGGVHLLEDLDVVGPEYEQLTQIPARVQHIMEPPYPDCVICKDGYDVDEEVKQLPCNHFYHVKCIKSWLELHSSCPVCRFQLPAVRSCDASTDAGGVSASGGNTSSENTGICEARNNGSQDANQGNGGQITVEDIDLGKR